MNNILHKCLLSDNVPNMIIYGRPFIYHYFIDLYYEINNINKDDIRNKNCERLYYRCSQTHYEFDCKKFNKDNCDDFNQLFKSLIEIKEYYIDSSHKTIIFYNCDILKTSIQNKFRVIIEKYRKTCVFIFLCYKINRLIDPLKSRCILLRMPQLSIYQKCQITTKIDNQKDLVLKNKIYDHLGMFPSTDDSTAINICKEKLHDFKNHYHLLADKIIKIIKIKNMTIHCYTLIKGYSYDILKYNLDIQLFLKILLNVFIDEKQYKPDVLFKIIKLFSETEHQLLQSYKMIILIEGFFISLHKTIHS
jgi:hypothetical protein